MRKGDWPGKMENIDMVQKERDRKVMEIVHNFLLAAQTFRQQYEKYQHGSLHFTDVAKLVDEVATQLGGCGKTAHKTSPRGSVLLRRAL